jgi:hypothetical protein
MASPFWVTFDAAPIGIVTVPPSLYTESGGLFVVPKIAAANVTLVRLNDDIVVVPFVDKSDLNTATGSDVVNPLVWSMMIKVPAIEFDVIT